MSDGPPEQLKRFVFTSKYTNLRGEPQEETLEVIIPELLQASYSFYTWPSAPVLAWFLWENRKELVGKRVLEIGSGTALPGIVAAKCGAKVILSDSVTLRKSLAHTKRSCQLNNLIVNQHIQVIGLTWGLFLNNLDTIGELDLILGSDCFYEPAVFEDILVSISYLLEANQGCKFFCTYQERSSDWSIEHLLAKWNLHCQVHNISNLGATANLNIHELVGDHKLGIDCETNDSLTEMFNKAANHLQSLIPNLDNQTLLTLYGYYKQGSQGRCTIPKPSWYDMKAKSKWEAWNKLGEMPQNKAKSIYIETIKKLDPSFNFSAKESWVSVSTFQNDQNVNENKNKSIVDYVKEEDCPQVFNILQSSDGIDLINRIDEDGLGLIHWASDRGCAEILKVLIDFGADVNLQDSDGQTALHYATSCGHVDCIKLLLTNNARRDILDNDNSSPESVACDDAVKE
ncbi:methyltransferase-like protein 23, partial [Asbolus verrucosus]